MKKYVKSTKPAPSSRVLTFQQDMSEGAHKSRIKLSPKDAALLETQPAHRELLADTCLFFRQQQAAKPPFMAEETNTANHFDITPGHIMPSHQADSTNSETTFFSFGGLYDPMQLSMHQDATVFFYSTALLVIGRKIFGSHNEPMKEDSDLEWHYSP